MTSTQDTDGRTTGDLTCAVFMASGSIEGYVFDRTNLSRHLVLELLLDGWPHQVRRADLVDLRSPIQPQDGQHGFCFSLPDPCTARHAEVRLANTQTILAGPLDLSGVRAEASSALAPGRVSWEGDLLIGGYLDLPKASGLRVRGFIDGALVFEVATSGWTHLPHGDRRKPVPTFEAHLPARFADGTVHRIDVSTSQGQTLGGSPLHVLAFPDGLERRLWGDPALAPDHLRGRIFDRLMPRSVPFSSVDDWISRFPVQGKSASVEQATAFVVVGEAGIEETVASLERSATPWTLGVLPSDDGLSFDPEELRTFLEQEAAACTTIVLAVGGTRFHPQAGAHLSISLAGGQGLAFADVLIAQPSGAPLPLAYGSFDLERALEQGAGCTLLAISYAVAMDAARDGASSLFDLFFRAFDAIGDKKPAHVPGFLAMCPEVSIASATSALAAAIGAHLARHGGRGAATPGRGVVMPAVRVVRGSASERISVMLPVRNDAEGLRRSVESIRSIRSRHGVDLHVVDMASSEAATAGLLKRLTGHHQHVHVSRETWNVARALNGAIGDVRNRFVLYLECGSRFEEADWLDELVGRCAEPDVAAVGPLLVLDKVVVAAGLVGGPAFGFAAAFAGLAADAPGYADLLRVARSCVALPLAGLMIKRSELTAVGGLDDERFGRYLHSVDLGLKLAARGRRMICTPHVRLSLSRPPLFPVRPESTERPGFAGEIDALRCRWGNAILDDPFYGPALAHSAKPFSGLAWPPRSASLHSATETLRSAGSEG